MTLFSLRTGLALLLAASLAACGGGGKATFPITGTVTGLAYDGLVLKTDKQTVTIAKSTTNTDTTIYPVTYTFPQVLEYGDVFLVSLAANPPHQTCEVGQVNPDSAGHTASINVAVSCSINSYPVSGYVTGLVGDGLQLINGSTNGTIVLTKTIVDANAATEATAKAAAPVATPTVYTRTPSFSFQPVAFGQAYGVTILTQPAGQTCTVTNGTGKMGDEQVLNIAVNCVNNT